jgi:hypothetical protein
LRKSAVAIALVLVASLGIIVPSVAAATGDPKVVIIVGATGSVTPSYRADADVAYAEAIRYTSNVVKVYSPNATWAKVKAAVVGASVVIYMGHGNGWPSPYGNDAAYTTKDGFGLNATAGAGDYNNTYYGEPSIATLDLAPGAIVLLNHLCYASGNSEPGNAEGTVTVARQRADNYAAGFLKAGAAAVIADGHAGAEGYLRRIFTTHQSIESMWRTMPNENGNIVSFPSVRTPGATVFQDPNTPTTGFYRSLAIGSLGVTTDEVIAAGYGATGTLTVDTKAPALTGLAPGSDTVQWFSPNGDGVRDTVALTATSSETGSLAARVLGAGGAVVRTWTVANGSGPTSVTWDGRTNAGAYAPDGAYVLRVAPVDAAGNAGQSLDRTVSLIGALRSVLSSKTIFFPSDLDALAKTTKLSFVLARPMTVTWTLRNAAGATVITRLSGSVRPAGTYYWIFDGRLPSGTMLPRGRYTSQVTATGGTLSATQTTAFDLDAFAITPSDSTPGRGQSITVTARSAESLAKAPMLYIYQPGVAAWSVRMTKTATNVYRATIRMKTSGGSGRVSLKVWGRDVNGGAQATTKVYPLH